ncbi:hypothetical protein MCHIJ_30420 [Mycolicibacterium chitae]|uniref:Prohead peptidase n=1 Tax=Mycolicibacterium chitae TaxID=1792 RepID=A0A3S4VGX0_MYCCI|nr:hypothetical protein [Mycolicibacterium chitae]MCV7108918.1 hypothetical protein [Mycolicibacterium chitae]BBZ03605.1 hypothetical protein MCHIJ_30420 [Mycolicibacterium chitae]VEG47260.1 prohead peptidase [Mycolicibacterium chitae]
MSKRNNIDELVTVSDEELRGRLETVTARIQTRVDRAQTEDRDLSTRESDLTRQDMDELRAIRDAYEVRDAERTERERVETESRTRAAQIGSAIDEHRAGSRQAFTNGAAPSLLVSADNLHRHAAAMAAGQTYGAVETRATVQVNPAAGSSTGSPAAWAQTGPRDPRHLIGYAGIPVQQLTGDKAVLAQYTLPSGASGVDEVTPHGEYDDVVDVPLTAVRYGRWSKVSAAVDQFVTLEGLSNAHAVGIARDLDLSAVSAIESAAASALAFETDVAGHMRYAANTVAANVYAQVEDLVIVGTPADIAVLQAVHPANGPDAGSVTARFAGARLYPSQAATAGLLTVFAPAAFAVFMSPLQSASQIDPTDGSNRFGSWLHATPVGQGLVGGAVSIATVDGS